MPQFQLLPPNPSFGSQLGAALGGGVSQGLSASLNSYLENKKQASMMKNLQEALGISPQTQQKSPLTDEQFTSQLPQIEQGIGRDLTPQDLDVLYKNMQAGRMGSPQQAQRGIGSLTPEKVIAASAIAEKAGFPHLGTAISSIYKGQEKKESEERAVFGEGAKEFWKKLGEKRDKLPNLKSSLEAQMNAVMRGDVDPFSRGHIADIAKSLGAPSSITAPLETPGSKEFKTGLKTYLSSTLKDAFRGATTGREIELAEGLLAQAGSTREGNLASLWLLQSQYMITEKEQQLATELRRQGYSPYEVPDMVAEQIEPYRKYLSSQYIEAIDSLSGKK